MARCYWVQLYSQTPHRNLRSWSVQSAAEAGSPVLRDAVKYDTLKSWSCFGGCRLVFIGRGGGGGSLKGQEPSPSVSDRGWKEELQRWNSLRNVNIRTFSSNNTNYLLYKHFQQEYKRTYLTSNCDFFLYRDQNNGFEVAQIPPPPAQLILLDEEHEPYSLQHTAIVAA